MSHKHYISKSMRQLSAFRLFSIGLEHKRFSRLIDLSLSVLKYFATVCSVAATAFRTSLWVGSNGSRRIGVVRDCRVACVPFLFIFLVFCSFLIALYVVLRLVDRRSCWWSCFVAVVCLFIVELLAVSLGWWLSSVSLFSFNVVILPSPRLCEIFVNG